MARIAIRIPFSELHPELRKLAREARFAQARWERCMRRDAFAEKIRARTRSEESYRQGLISAAGRLNESGAFTDRLDQLICALCDEGDLTHDGSMKRGKALKEFRVAVEPRHLVLVPPTKPAQGEAKG
ncbi:MAG: hypothetical protein V1708_02195 [Candidatus Micrarchaeota archaeon]